MKSPSVCPSPLGVLSLPSLDPERRVPLHDLQVDRVDEEPDELVLELLGGGAGRGGRGGPVVRVRALLLVVGVLAQLVRAGVLQDVLLREGLRKYIIMTLGLKDVREMQTFFEKIV